MTQLTNKPVNDIQIGRVKATIWRNETEDGKACFNVVFSRLYNAHTRVLQLPQESHGEHNDAATCPRQARRGGFTASPLSRSVSRLSRQAPGRVRPQKKPSTRRRSRLYLYIVVFEYVLVLKKSTRFSGWSKGKSTRFSGQPIQ